MQRIFHLMNQKHEPGTCQ